MINLQKLLNQKGYNLKPDGVVGPKTLAATQDFITKEIQKRNWKIPAIGFVFLRLDQTLTNTFDDVIVRFNRGIVDRVAPCSTTAGQHYIKNPITYGGIRGTAIAKEQQIINSHQFNTSANWKSLWLGAPYFQQISSIDIYRDGNMDNKLDKAILQKGLFGINFHRAGAGSFIDNWSAGCQVTPDKFWYDLISIFRNGQFIDFTLIEV